MKHVWIQVEGVAEPFTVGVQDNCFVHKLRQAILGEKSRTLKGLKSTDLVVYASKKAFEERGEEDTSRMEVDDAIFDFGGSRAQDLFVTVTKQPSPPSSPSSSSAERSVSDADARLERWK